MIPGRKFSNQVHFLQRQDFYQVFIPAYLRMTFKKITQINIQDSCASMIATIILTVYYKGIPDNIKQNLANKLVLTIGEEHVLLNQNQNKTKTSEMPTQHTFTFTYRDVFKLQMSGSVFMVPFDVQTLSIKAYLRTIQCTQKLGGKKVLLRFNLMDNQNEIVKFSANKIEDMGEFGLIKSMLNVKYSNQLAEAETAKLTKQDKLFKPHPFHLATFNLGIYRFPINTLLMIFIPLWLLALINLSVFFQNNDIKNRISNIATLMVAYAAFLPTIRSKIPPSPHITLIEIITYTLLATLVFCLIQSLILTKKESTFVFVWFNSVFFLISLVISSLSFIIIASLYLLHKTKWQLGYMRMTEGKLVPFKSEEWENLECDMYFADMKPNLRPIAEISS